jgi:hypothetical protein
MKFIGLKLPQAVVDEARRQAIADSRPLSAYLRLIITEAVERETDPHAAAAHSGAVASRV